MYSRYFAMYVLGNLEEFMMGVVQKLEPLQNIKELWDSLVAFGDFLEVLDVIFHISLVMQLIQFKYIFKIIKKLQTLGVDKYKRFDELL